MQISQGIGKQPENCMSSTGFLIRYQGCNIYWKSQLQTEITLSTAESEYVALSQALRSATPVLNTLIDLHKVFPQIDIPKPKVHITVHEDNTSAILMATSEKFTPRTKHIALKYHWFKRYVTEGLIEIRHISTTDQLADVLKKPLDETTFKRLRKKICGY